MAMPNQEGVPDGFQSFLFYHTAFLDLVGHLAFHVTELEKVRTMTMSISTTDWAEGRQSSPMKPSLKTL